MREAEPGEGGRKERSNVWRDLEEGRERERGREVWEVEWEREGGKEG